MRGKLLFITGGLVGYVLGARAGRKRYDQIVAAASDFWQARPVQRRVTEARDFAIDAVGDAPAALFEAGKKAFSAFQAKQAKAQAKAQAAASAPHPSAARAQAAAKVAKSAPTTATPAGATPADAASAAADETTTN